MVYICIPCRDEDRTIGVLLWKIREVMAELERDYEVIVLDGASRDGTPALLSKYERVMPLSVLSLRKPVGYGAAVEKLLRSAVGRARYPKRDAIVTMQGDFTEHPDHLRPLLRTFEGGADIVAGGATPENPGPPPPRAVRLARALGRIALGRAQTRALGDNPFQGFRAYRAVVVRKALRIAGDNRLVTTDGWAANAELMKVLAPFARRVAHVPAAPRYDVRWRRSRVRVLATVREILRVRKVSPLEPERPHAA